MRFLFAYDDRLIIVVENCFLFGEKSGNSIVVFRNATTSQIIYGEKAHC